jgi:peptidyl-prolyl cis-trans isomerase D
MATIEKIRNQRGLLILFIGIGMLAFLVPYDAVMAMFGAGANKTIGNAGGASISYQDYSNAVRERDELLDYQTKESLENEVWSEILQKNLLDPRFEETGIYVTPEEFEEITYGENLSAFVTSTFYGRGSEPAVKEQWKLQFEEWEESDPRRFKGYQQAIISKRKKEKWDVLVKRGMYANSLEGKYDFKYKSDTRTFDYVFASYESVPDSLVTVNEGDIRSYYRDHKNDVAYEQRTQRDIKYVEFKIDATPEDIAAINTEVTKLKTKWSETDNDSAFCVLNGNTGQFFRFDYKDGDFSGVENSNIIGDSIGSLIGPYEDNKFVRVVKVLDRMNLPDSAEVRHILLKTRPEENAFTLQERGDSLLAVIKSGSSTFEELVAKHSEDPGSVEKGGLYEYFGRGRMVKPFEDACFKGDVGDLTSAVTQYGIHVIEILGQKDFKQVTNLAAIDRPIRASAATISSGYNTANEFAIMHSDLESFENAADTMGYAVVPGVNIAPSAISVGALRDASEVVNWTYAAEKDEVSFPIQLGDKYIVAVLVEARIAGVPPFENIKDEMEIEVLKEKKAIYLKEQFGTVENLANAAAKIGSKVGKANKISMVRTTIPGAGKDKETDVLGFAFGVPVNHVTEPISGASGVYVISGVEDITNAEEKDNYIDEQDGVIKSVQARSTGLTTGFYGAIKRSCKVEDNRFVNQ